MRSNRFSIDSTFSRKGFLSVYIDYHILMFSFSFIFMSRNKLDGIIHKISVGKFWSVLAIVSLFSPSSVIGDRFDPILYIENNNKIKVWK